MTIKNKLVIYYPVGARGDFLAAILLNAKPRFFDYSMIRYPPEFIEEYYKLHDIDANPQSRFFKGSVMDIKRNRSIRIKLNSIDDFLSSVYYRMIKVEKHTLNLPYVFKKLVDHELFGRRIDYNFKYTVNFADLFDVDFLKDFYYTYNQITMPDELLAPIIHNIGLQPRVTVDNYSEYITDLSPHTVTQVKNKMCL